MLFVPRRFRFYRVSIMSDNTGSALGGLSLMVSIAGMVYTAVNHKRIRGKCCGRNIEMELDIGSTTDDAEKGSAKVHPEPTKTNPISSSIPTLPNTE